MHLINEEFVVIGQRSGLYNNIFSIGKRKLDIQKVK